MEVQDDEEEEKVHTNKHSQIIDNKHVHLLSTLAAKAEVEAKGAKGSNGK